MQQIVAKGHIVTRISYYISSMLLFPVKLCTLLVMYIASTDVVTSHIYKVAIVLFKSSLTCAIINYARL